MPIGATSPPTGGRKNEAESVPPALVPAEVGTQLSCSWPSSFRALIPSSARTSGKGGAV